MEASNLGYHDWLYALYLVVTNLKSVASMKMHRELGITQKSAWHLVHRIRKGWATSDGMLFNGPVEVDETYIGGRRRNMKKSKREALTGRGPVGKVAVVGVKDRETNQVSAQVVSDTTAETLQGFVGRNVISGTTIYTDEATAYTNLPNHESVKHSVSEYVRGQVHTNGIESFWYMRRCPKLSCRLERRVEFILRHFLLVRGSSVWTSAENRSQSPEIVITHDLPEILLGQQECSCHPAQRHLTVAPAANNASLFPYA